jgi:hypothetical protein
LVKNDLKDDINSPGAETTLIMFSVAKCLLLFIGVALPGASGSGSLASCILYFTEKLTIFSNFATPYFRLKLIAFQAYWNLRNLEFPQRNERNGTAYYL